MMANFLHLDYKIQKVQLPVFTPDLGTGTVSLPPESVQVFRETESEFEGKGTQTPPS